MKVIELNLPEYTVDQEPNHKAIGKKVDDVLKQHFMGQTVLIRALGSMEHQDKSVDDMIEIIKATGTDRYDPERPGDRYDNHQGKHIDLFALRRTISERSKIFWQLSWSFYKAPLRLRGHPVRVDILVLYDPNQFKAVTHQPVGHPNVKRDGFVFRNPEDKAEAILGIIKLT